MKLLGQTTLGVCGILFFASCSLFDSDRPYRQRDRRAPLVIDRPDQDRPVKKKDGDCGPVDYLLPWRLISCDR